MKAEQGSPREEASKRGPTTGLYLYGVVRTRSWRSARRAGGDAEALLRVRYRDIEALVEQVSYALPPLDDEHLLEHQRTVEMVMRRSTILPLPYGVVFQGRRSLIRFLQDQYLVLDEGLAFLEGHWELRLHLNAAAAEAGPELSDLAMHVYAELRRFARAAIPFPREGQRLLSAAFLVQRSGWIEFIERGDELGAAHPELQFDITGPWPPYDFVKISV